MKVDVYNQKGEKAGQAELPKTIFEVAYNEDLIHQALVRQLANRRLATAKVKTRGEIRGGGRKPFKQKGTGNARQGTIRAPHMRGGGVVFGPSNNRNFTKQMPKKQRRKALFSALSEKARKKEVLVLDKYDVKAPKTKDFAAMIAKMPVERNALVVIAEKDLNLTKSAANIPNVKTVLANYINIHDLQKYRTVILLQDAVKKLEETFVK
jgi:large subunit ribosomal protein L4